MTQVLLFISRKVSKMFKTNLYITRGINDRVQTELVSLLWTKVQEKTSRKLDYLQVFDLKNTGTKEEPVLEVTWSQEVPKHKEVFYVKGLSCSEEKIWIICTGEGTKDEYSTMLLPEEY